MSHKPIIRLSSDGFRKPLTGQAAMHLAQIAYDEGRLRDAIRLVEIGHMLFSQSDRITEDSDLPE